MFFGFFPLRFLVFLPLRSKISRSTWSHLYGMVSYYIPGADTGFSRGRGGVGRSGMKVEVVHQTLVTCYGTVCAITSHTKHITFYCITYFILVELFLGEGLGPTACAHFCFHLGIKIYLVKRSTQMLCLID